MKREDSKHETDNIKRYQEEGYMVNYLFENDHLIDSESKVAYKPEDIFIVAHHRYEGMSDPDDMSILYIIETKDGGKGTHLLGYGSERQIWKKPNFLKTSRKPIIPKMQT
ncbi:hypothetical protein [Flavobacterium sp. MMS24-S5]|uniref:hypothetical protein n=1 Tax=Flavobacterium sp. MMS24-S5 TaxID=3416605 RepID=UPI003CFBC38E